MTSIAVDGVTLQRGGATLLDGLSLSLGPTGSVAVIGPNGAGKSMLLKTLAGIIAPSAGTVRIDGANLNTLASTERARMIGYLPQQFEPHWDLSVAELVRLGAERVSDAAPQPIETTIATYELAAIRERRWSTLSGGERARVLLAMVLAVDPPALLADEPGASLDIRHRLDVVAALARRASNRLCVVVMHDLELAFRYFERVVILDRGRIVADAPALELFDDPRLDAAFGVRFERLRTAHGPMLCAT